MERGGGDPLSPAGEPAAAGLGSWGSFGQKEGGLVVFYFVGGSRLILSLSLDLLRARQEVAAAAAARNPGAMEAHIPSGSNSSSQRRKQGLPQHRDTHFPERYLRGGGHGSARPLGRAGRGSPPPRGGVSSGHGLGKGLRFLGKGLGGLQAAPWGPQGGSAALDEGARRMGCPAVTSCRCGGFGVWGWDTEGAMGALRTACLLGAIPALPQVPFQPVLRHRASEGVEAGVLELPQIGREEECSRVE